jgi:hypothetical protein
MPHCGHAKFIVVLLRYNASVQLFLYTFLVNLACQKLLPRMSIRIFLIVFVNVVVCFFLEVIIV